MLSISYIVTELFLIGVYLIIQEHEIFAFNFTQLLNAPQYTEEIEQPNYSQEIIDFFKAGISTLTESELNVYNAYLEGKTQKDIAKESGVKVGTVKFHTTHLYEKLGITSRKSLLEISKIINAE